MCCEKIPLFDLRSLSKERLIYALGYHEALLDQMITQKENPSALLDEMLMSCDNSGENIVRFKILKSLRNARFINGQIETRAFIYG